jgi:hypothetical protein
MAITINAKGARSYTTKKDLEGLKTEAEVYNVWDAGFNHGSLGVRVAPTGAKSIFMMYRLPNGKQTKATLSKLDAWLATGQTLAQLHAEARRVIEGGKESGLTTSEAKLAEIAAQTSIREAGEAYLDHRTAKRPYVNRGKGQGTEGAMRQAIERAEKVWGSKPLTKLTVTDAENLMVYIRDTFGPSAALKARSLLPTVLKFVKRTQTDVNVDIFRGMELKDDFFLTEDKKAGVEPAVLTADQRGAYFDALRMIELGENRDGLGRAREAVADKCDFLRLTYLCAARKQDWMLAKWSDIDLETRDWHRGERKRGSHTMKLPAAAVPILERIKARRLEELSLITRRGAKTTLSNDDLVFGGRFSLTQLRDVHKHAVIMGRCDPRLTIHDLKASRVTQYHIEMKLSTIEIGHMIGNKDVATLIRHYVRDNATEAERLSRVDAEGDDLIA